MKREFLEGLEVNGVKLSKDLVCVTHTVIVRLIFTAVAASGMNPNTALRLILILILLLVYFDEANGVETQDIKESSVEVQLNKIATVDSDSAAGFDRQQFPLQRARLCPS